MTVYPIGMHAGLVCLGTGLPGHTPVGRRAEGAMVLELAEIVSAAKKRDALRPPSGNPVIEIRLDGSPTHLMSNAVAAFQREIEDVFLRRTEIAGGGLR